MNISCRRLLATTMALSILSLLCSEAGAETVIYKDKNGVYRSMEKEPENKGKPKSVTAGEKGRDKGRDEIWVRINKFCSDVLDLDSTLLTSFYYEDAREIRRHVKETGFSEQEQESAIERLDDCVKQLRHRESELKRKERRASAEKSKQQRQEESFEKLVPYVKEKLEERRRSGVTLARERFATPIQIQKMTYPLSYGMSAKDVRYLWGRPLWIYGKKGGASETWRYPVGVELHFSNDKLDRWRQYR